MTEDLHKYRDFKFTMPIKKSYEVESEDGTTHQFIKGLASGISVDHHAERMAKSAVDAFKKAIEDGIILPSGDLSMIPLRSGHRPEWDDILGWVTKAEIDEDYNLWIEAELDQTSSTARDLFAKLHAPPQAKRPLQLGFSVGGKIRKASWTTDELTKERVRIIEDASLREISVVGSPAFPTAYIETLYKSVDWDDLEQVQESTMTQPTDVQNAEEVTKSDAADNSEQKDSNANATALENVTKSEDAAADPQADLVKSADFDTLKTEVETLTKGFTTLTESVKTLTETLTKSATKDTKTVVANEDVTKAEGETKEEAKEETLEKSLEDRIAGAIAAALTPIVTDLQGLKKGLEELAEQPMDKSLSVAQNKQSDEDLDPVTKARKDIEGGETILGSFIKQAYRPQE